MTHAVTSFADRIMNLMLSRVLVVDDDEVMRTFVVNSLRRLGIQAIETAADGASALRTMVTFKPIWY